MITLKEAITHAKEQARVILCEECAAEHKQLAK